MAKTKRLVKSFYRLLFPVALLVFVAVVAASIWLVYETYQDSTSRLSKCFLPTSRIAVNTNLSPSGFSIINASIELSQAYDQRVIDHFRQSLSGQETQIAVR